MITNKIVKSFATAVREASQAIETSDDIKLFIDKMTALCQTDDVPEQIMGVVLARVCWLGSAKIDDISSEVCESLDDCGKKF